MLPRGPFSSSDPAPARKIIRPAPFTVTASEKMPLVQALWVNSFFSNAGGDGCCAMAGTASAATIAAAINEVCFGMKGLPRAGLATGQAYQAARIVRRPFAALDQIDPVRQLVAACLGGREVLGKFVAA